MRPTRHHAGDRVGPWLLEAPLGQGGFSEVWRARWAPAAAEPPAVAPPATLALRPTTRRFLRDATPGEVVALKLHVHPEQAAQLRAEADALAHTVGPGVVRVLDLDLTADPPWLALELLDQSLRQREERLREVVRAEASGAPAPAGAETLDVVRALETFEDLLGVLARVHRQGVVHGDLKPENVLFTSGGQLRVADFGLSRRISQRTATLSVSLSQEDVRLAGTLDYMAPEQRRGERPTTRSDVFALGVILYELLTGRRPQGAFELPSALVPAVPPAIDRVVACCLAAEPQRRFATAGAVLAFLRGLARDDWRRLEAARGRVRALLAHGVVQELLRPGAFRFAQLFVGGVTAFALVRMVSAELVTRAALPPALAGVALATLLVLGSWRLLGPWLAARHARLTALAVRLETQARTGRAWARASAPGRARS